jgi:NAD(P)-dependent dehydrogenase (short-subunit alcohol dehydrogenase family)
VGSRAAERSERREPRREPRLSTLDGKVVLITGATSGIGLEAARSIAALGAHVVVGARNATRGLAVVDEIRANGGSAELLEIDLASLESVARAAAEFKRKHPRLDVLVNNAGIIAGKRKLSPDGHELTWATNFLGLAALTRALVPALEAADAPRVVNVSSAAHTSGRMAWNDLELERGYQGLRAYAQSKLAVNLWTRAFAKRYPKIDANAMHPGAIATNIWSTLPAFAQALIARVLPPASKGAIPVVRLATSDDVAGVSGHYFNKLQDAPHAPAARNDDDAERLWTYVETTLGGH